MRQIGIVFARALAVYFFAGIGGQLIGLKMLRDQANEFGLQEYFWPAVFKVTLMFVIGLLLWIYADKFLPRDVESDALNGDADSHSTLARALVVVGGLWLFATFFSLAFINYSRIKGFESASWETVSVNAVIALIGLVPVIFPSWFIKVGTRK